MRDDELYSLKEAILEHFTCVREMETARHAEAEDFVFLCQMGITPDLTLEENNVAH